MWKREEKKEYWLMICVDESNKTNAQWVPWHLLTRHLLTRHLLTRNLLEDNCSPDICSPATFAHLTFAHPPWYMLTRHLLTRHLLTRPLLTLYATFAHPTFAHPICDICSPYVRQLLSLTNFSGTQISVQAKLSENVKGKYFGPEDRKK